MKSQKGITLIILIVTIVILVILAEISIASLVRSGFFTQAQRAKREQENAQIKENTTLEEYENLIEQQILGRGENTPNDSITWTMNAETNEITGGGKTLYIGDYVNYQTKVSDATTEQLDALNTKLTTYLSSDHASLSNEPLSWRVLDVVNGQLRLISADTTATSVPTNKILLSSAQGYCNGVNLIDEACKTLYNSNYASKVQNLKIEDIETHLKTKPTLSDTSETLTVYTYPAVLGLEVNQKINGITGNLGVSEPIEELIEPANALKRVKADLEVKVTNISINMSTTSFENEIYYKLFMKKENSDSAYPYYWISSRGFSTYSNGISCSIRCVYTDVISGVSMWYSNGTSYGDYALRPIVTLNSNVSIGTGNGDTIPYELQM